MKHYSNSSEVVGINPHHLNTRPSSVCRTIAPECLHQLSFCNTEEQRLLLLRSSQKKLTVLLPAPTVSEPSLTHRYLSGDDIGMARQCNIQDEKDFCSKLGNEACKPRGVVAWRDRRWPIEKCAGLERKKPLKPSVASLDPRAHAHVHTSRPVDRTTAADRP